MLEEQVTYWEAFERAAYWSRRSAQNKQHVFIDVARCWLDVARWMRLNKIERTTV